MWTLDSILGYFQIAVKSQVIAKTAYITSLSFKWMKFDLTGAPSTFQKDLIITLKYLLGVRPLVCLENYDNGISF